MSRVRMVVEIEFDGFVPELDTGLSAGEAAQLCAETVKSQVKRSLITSRNLEIARCYYTNTIEMNEGERKT